MAYTLCNDLYSDLHKEAFGFRPRDTAWMVWAESSDDEKQALWDRLVEAAKERAALEAQEEAYQIATWTHTFAIAADCGIPREVFLDAMHAVYNTFGDDDFLCWHIGVPYGFFK
jgi:hypothetical protein